MAQAGDIPEKRVLIVDDSKFVRTTFNRILSASFAVRECADGESAWQAIEADPAIAMVVSDLDMPKLDGFALLERIRGSAEARIKALPVIIISGNQNEAAKKRARDLGANDFVSKEADAPEVLSRIDNLLKLVKASHELEENKQVLEQTVTHDPLTGTFTPHYLMTEGRKHFSHARRHGGLLSVMAFRIDSYADVAKAVGKDVADQLLARIARLASSSLRTEDSIGRAAESTFIVISTGPGASQAMTFARRLYEQLKNAQVAYRGQPLRIVSSFGVASLAQDTAGSVEELMKVALGRLQRAGAGKEGERIVGGEEITVVKPASLPSDIERAVQVLEHASAERLGEASNEVLRRLLPFLQGAFKRVKIDLPVDRISAILARK
ncbi:MAG TPA: response regulator [Burkholderiales bacterium]|nr:response regulator [Burkholderiales bacterium]